MYRNIGDVWTKIGSDIDGESIGDYSGEEVALSSDGSVIAIGSPYNDGNGNAGGVHSTRPSNIHNTLSSPPPST